MAISANLGFPRIGAKRELKKAVEAYWKGELNQEELKAAASDIRSENWEYQKQAGLDVIPSNDFSLYDQVLDMIALVGAVPQRYKHNGGDVSLNTYFAMARGAQKDGLDVKAMQMTKWFDTNYHYIVPEFSKGQEFALSSSKIFDEYKEAKALGIQTRPVILGPVSFLALGKTHDEGFNRIDLLPKLLQVYGAIISKLGELGADWIQIDEPCLVLDLEANVRDAYKTAFAAIASAASSAGIKTQLTTYFGGLKDNLDVATELPVNALHVDLVRSPEQLDNVLAKIGKNVKISLGVVDGRNIWKNNFAKSLEIINKAVEKVGSDNVIIAPSCSLLHSPVDLDSEVELEEEIKSWLSFARQKVKEIAVLTKAVNEGEDSVCAILEENAKAHQNRKTSKLIHNDEVKKRASSVTQSMFSRKSPYKERAKVQRKEIDMPVLPTTTIGSFPQTQEVRTQRAKFKSGELTSEQYNKFLREEAVRCIRFQEQCGIDILVHGEFERNDMVEYFGEQLNGFAFTKFGWVQSYGSRCVKPPVIFGDVSRDKPMTVDWAKFSQEQTDKYMKGMLTGPVTILQWSFVRDDQPRSETCKQIGLAIRDEVVDLESAGIKIIQIDEAALREGLPLRKSEWSEYLKWAVEAFRLSASGVKDGTQIHTHMCYSEFNDIIKSIGEMDADVISVETSRSQMELLDAFASFKYPNEIGPGVYDIHSPRVPSQQEMEELLRLALKNLTAEQLWVNPDCGLKTRGWKEVEPALKAMVAAAKAVRADIESGAIAQAS
ncbi:MAG: 5-methyltetrahydropteroyltriglutamate--homocysteine S-methyltransferase [Alphaproteobacteria bacterium CG11_big_fil_rev_8_21_14_0_20_39_49]|nr:MAG: 5-methyltetrahydropteroyltriglutamate--homocysteine S-methyltransferase [Alphaproteobacteria bacterium CG11_big_fil_rev_8_21_14_0_20_39_49]